MSNTIQTNTSLFFKGREGDPRLGEWATASDKQIFANTEVDAFYTFAMIGAPDDLGVALNRGRPGAKGGPDAVRQAFYKFAWPIQKSFAKFSWFDLGNIQIHESITETHHEAYAAASLCASRGATVIAIGGGHDFAAPHILGTFDGMTKYIKGTQARSKSRSTSKADFGIINVDPHLDVREFENNLPHSGTPFRQIIESKVVTGKNLVQFGARNGRNAKSHFDYCKKHKIPVFEFGDIRSAGDSIKLFQKQLSLLAKRTSAIALTIDMDACSDIEGVSAAPVIGFTPWELCSFALAAGANPKVKMLELAEIAPHLDPTGRAARIGAEVLFHFLLGRLGKK